MTTYEESLAACSRKQSVSTIVRSEAACAAFPNPFDDDQDTRIKFRPERKIMLA